MITWRALEGCLVSNGPQLRCNLGAITVNSEQLQLTAPSAWEWAQSFRRPGGRWLQPHANVVSQANPARPCKQGNTCCMQGERHCTQIHS